MKKIMMTLAAVAVAATMNAQSYVGGSFGFTSVSHDGDNVTAFKVMPEIGTTLTDDLAVGISFGYAQSGKGNNKVKAWGVNPYLRYTFAKFDKVNVFVDGTVGYQSTDDKKVDYKTNEFEVGLKPGVAVNLTDEVSFVAHFGLLGYNYSKPDFDGAKATNTFGVNLDSNVSFGLYFNF